MCDIGAHVAQQRFDSRKKGLVGADHDAQLSALRRLSGPSDRCVGERNAFRRQALGHAAGDLVLREFARLTLLSLRDGDSLGRLGGEEFGILLPETNMADALTLAERLREQSEAHAVSGSFGQCRYSISIGAAVSLEGETFDHLSARADRALYAAKHSGRNRVLAGGHRIVEAEAVALMAES